MSAIPGIISLAKSRKALVTLLAAMLVLLNKKFDLGFSDQEVLVVVGALSALVLGIAVEDAGEKRGAPPGKVLGFLLAVSMVLSATTGCQISTKVRDEATIASIERAISARTADFARYDFELARSRAAAEAHAADAAAVRRSAEGHGVRDFPSPPTQTATGPEVQRGLRAMNEAELDRLLQLLARERAKMDPAEAGAP